MNDGIKIQAIQPSILFLSGEKLLAIGRSRQEKVFEVRSEDGGETWQEMTLGSLPNNNSGTDAVTLKDGRHVIVYNHIGGTPGKWGGKRTPLNIAVSTDAEVWQAALVLESDPGEYSYPAVIQTKDGRLHVTYTWKRQKVKHVVIDPTNGPPSPSRMENGRNDPRPLADLLKKKETSALALSLPTMSQLARVASIDVGEELRCLIFIDVAVGMPHLSVLFMSGFAKRLETILRRRVAENAEGFNFDFYDISVLKKALRFSSDADPRRSAGENNVANVERHHLRDIRNKEAGEKMSSLVELSCMI